MRTLLIRNGRVIDPARNSDSMRDLWIVDGKFADEGFSVGKADEIIDAGGKLVMPGFVDVHVHLREPGNEAAETIATGCAAALAGGFTSIICMPNTTPVLDTPDQICGVLEKAAALRGPHVYAMGAITAGREGRKLADLEALAQAGAVGFTDDGNGVQQKELLEQAMKRAATLRLPIVEHCEDLIRSQGGVMHQGAAAERTGLSGIPSEAEWAMVERDIRLSESTGGRLHLQHISAAESVEFVRKAKTQGIPVTAEVTPHHLTLVDEDAAVGGPNFKMNPPLRAKRDLRALQEGLREGVLEIIATDHAPHTVQAKERGFVKAPFGVIGMETAASIVWACLVMRRFLSPLQMAMRMSAAPAKKFGLPAGTLSPGHPADVVIFNPRARWIVEPEKFRSRGRNCPFSGWALEGRTAATIVNGEVRYRDDFR